MRKEVLILFREQTEAERKEENSMLKKIFDGRKSEIRKKESLKQAIILETQNQEQEFAKLQKTFEDEKIELEAAKKSVVKDAEWICKEVQKEEERVRVAEEKLNMCKAQTKAAENESLRMTELSEGVKLMQKRLEDYAEILKKTKEEEGLERESIMQLDSLKELIAEVHLVLDQRQEEIEELQSRKTTLKQEMESIRTDADKEDGAGVGVDSKAHSLRNLRQRVDHLETGTKALDRKKNFLEMQDKDAVDYWKKLLADLQKQRKAALQAYLKEGEAINKEIEDIMSRLREERDLLRFRKNGKESRSGGSQ
ncbi:unnamed protein product [Cyprideis torosa]|uniref:Uncharacterized protein n=1 Tax=Cyprideis torosa TaxID=163714 RepID=A0A7R8ZMH5_9CRUS|nr:unnamed protein product [Cyprideis torosa]CAG0885839.1 unnamed protein product [Cyprideis torosa]